MKRRAAALAVACAALAAAGWLFARADRDAEAERPARGVAASGEPVRASQAGVGPSARRSAPALHESAMTPARRTWDPRGFRISAPHLADPGERAAFERWWIDELLRRLAAWERAHPRADGYPSSAWTRGMLERLYDAAEEGPPGETETAIQARVASGLRIMDELAAAYGDSPSAIANQALPDDELEPPPLLPPGWEMTVAADEPPPPPAAPRPPTLPFAARPSPSPVPIPSPARSP